MRVRMHISGAIGDTPHEPGDVLDVSDAQGRRWIKAGIAEELGASSSSSSARSRSRKRAADEAEDEEV